MPPKRKIHSTDDTHKKAKTVHEGCQDYGNRTTEENEKSGTTFLFTK